MIEELSGIAGTAKALMDSIDDGDPTAVSELAALLPSLRAAAESGDIGAQNVLGGFLLEHEEKPAEALRWFESAANRGSAMGKRSLGFLYANGMGVPQDLGRAESLIKEAADAEDPYAQFNLAQLWWGEGDPQRVISLLRSAAEGGVIDALVVLGDLLGALGEQSQALESYERAAEAGDDRGMYAAATAYRDGIGCPANPVEALKWFFLMVESGNADSLHEAIQMARGMTDGEIRQAGQSAGLATSAEAMVDTVRKYR